MVGGDGEGQGDGEQDGEGGAGQPPTFNEQAKAMGAKGKKEYYEQDSTQWGNVNSVEQEAMREQVLAKIEAALKTRGTDSDKLQRLWEEIKGAKKEKWYERFLRLIGTRMSASSMWKSSWLRVSRKLGWMFPGRKHESRGGLTICWDTSGSVSDVEGSIFVAKTRQMAKAFGAPYLLVVCDAEVHFSKMIQSDKQLRSVEIKGGGGTSSLPVFDLLKKPEYKTDLLVYLTDLEIDFPETPPPYEVIWGVIGQKDKTMRAPFGKTYHLTVEE
jgi:predicted metal-dependent peptidase